MLRKLNGWQRLWLVGTVVLGLWFVGVWPLLELAPSHQSNFEYRMGLKRDLENPQCRIYQTARFETLHEPKYGEPCNHIYISRSVDERRDKPVQLPYTLEAYDKEADRHWREAFAVVLGIGFAATLLISAGVYFLGWVIAWIVAGFRTT